MNHYKAHGTCCTAIDFEVENGKVSYLKFTNGCRGNTVGIAKLALGMTPEEIIKRCKGIPCKGSTSCPDQLARAMEKYLAENA